MNFLLDIDHCLATLRKGGLILYPTDTIWGIGCDATNAAAVATIYQLKKRAEYKAMIVLLANEQDVVKYVTPIDERIFDYLKTTKKPTTIIYEGATGLAKNLITLDGTIAIRIVQDDFCKSLITKFGKPLVSTSANLSGQASPKNFSTIDPTIIKGVDYVVEYKRVDNTSATPSSIVKWNADGFAEIIRS
ncbi:MAG TPA: L-threonylcarbamoyladenylate synthase [Chitinophagaceae bacterium]|nr:L-threonylcarbamoyladenylate synthase [Chitinophagaceae bacterium]